MSATKNTEGASMRYASAAAGSPCRALTPPAAASINKLPAPPTAPNSSRARESTPREGTPRASHTDTMRESPAGTPAEASVSSRQYSG